MPIYRILSHVSHVLVAGVVADGGEEAEDVAVDELGGGGAVRVAEMNAEYRGPEDLAVLLPDVLVDHAAPIFATQYGHSGHDQRAIHGHDVDRPPSVQNPSKDIALMTFSEWLWHFFPKNFLFTSVLNEMNRVDETLLLTERELGVWLGLHFCMSMYPGNPRAKFWSLTERTVYDNAPYLGEAMSRLRFEKIEKGFHMPKQVHSVFPDFEDKFAEVRNLQDAWNAHMRMYGIVPSSHNCLDESMNPNHNPLTPGWQFVPRKPHPMGNMAHTIACGFCNIIWQIELYEGKDRPAHLPMLLYDVDFATSTSNGAIGGLMMRMTERIWGTAGICVFDSHFSSLKACIAMKKKGLYADAYIKMNGQNWPQHSHGKENELHMHAAAVPYCTSSALQGVWDEVPFHVAMFKDTAYVGMMFSTHGAPGLKKGVQQNRRHPIAAVPPNPTIHFQHDVNFWSYYFARASVDTNNHMRQGDLSLEAGWPTYNWVLKIFTFYLAVAETNACMAYNFFVIKPAGRKRITLHEFRKVLTKELMENTLQGEVVVRRRVRGDAAALSADATHALKQKPCFAGRCLGARREGHAFVHVFW